MAEFDLLDRAKSLSPKGVEEEQYDETVANLTKQMEQTATYEHYISRSWANLMRGKADLALADAMQAVKLGERNVGGYLRMGTAYEALGNVIEAEEAYRRGLKIGPNDAKLKKALADLGATLLKERGLQLLKANRPEEAVQVLSEGLGMPGAPVAALLSARCRAYLQVGNPVCAVEDAQESVRQAPTSMEGHLWLCEALWEIGDVEAAGQSAKEALGIEPHNEEFQSFLQRCGEEKHRSTSFVFLRQLLDTCTEENTARILLKWDSIFKPEHPAQILHAWQGELRSRISGKFAKHSMMNLMEKIEDGHGYRSVLRLCRESYAQSKALHRTFFLDVAITGWKALKERAGTPGVPQRDSLCLCLGYAYLERGKDMEGVVSEENIEMAALELEEAYAVLSVDVNPQQWAAVCQGLGEAYQLLANGPHPEAKLLKAAHYLEQSLQVYSLQEHSPRFVSVNHDIGWLYTRAGAQRRACRHLHVALAHALADPNPKPGLQAQIHCSLASAWTEGNPHLNPLTHKNQVEPLAVHVADACASFLSSTPAGASANSVSCELANVRRACWYLPTVIQAEDPVPVWFGQLAQMVVVALVVVRHSSVGPAFTGCRQLLSRLLAGASLWGLFDDGGVWWQVRANMLKANEHLAQALAIYTVENFPLQHIQTKVKFSSILAHHATLNVFGSDAIVCLFQVSPYSSPRVKSDVVTFVAPQLRSRDPVLRCPGRQASCGSASGSSHAMRLSGASRWTRRLSCRHITSISRRWLQRRRWRWRCTAVTSPFRSLRFGRGSPRSCKLRRVREEGGNGESGRKERRRVLMVGDKRHGQHSPPSRAAESEGRGSGVGGRVNAGCGAQKQVDAALLAAYEGSIRTLVRMGHYGEALHLSERSKGQAALALLLAPESRKVRPARSRSPVSPSAYMLLPLCPRRKGGNHRSFDHLARGRGRWRDMRALRYRQRSTSPDADAGAAARDRGGGQRLPSVALAAGGARAAGSRAGPRGAARPSSTPSS